jgi:hypothetical protein
MNNVLMSTALSLAFVFIVPAQAETSRQLGTHQHGEAKLNLSIDGESLAIEFETPAFNLVGFEHAPENSEQTQLIKQTLETLRHPADWLIFPKAAKCELETSQVSTSLELEGDSGHMEHGISVHSHDDTHEYHEDHHAQTADHADEHEHEHEHDSHTDFDADYVWHCHNPKALNGLTIQLMESYPNLTEIHLQALTPSTSLVAELKDKTSTVTF